MLQRAPAAHRPLFVGSEIYRTSTYGRRHPLAIPRVSTVIDLTRALGWLEDDAYLDSPRATPDELARFHAPDYVAAVQAAEADQRVSDTVRDRNNLGRLENPVFGEMFRRPATAAWRPRIACWTRGAPAPPRQSTTRPAAPTTVGPTAPAASATSTTRRWASCACLTAG